jgi:hypothetical protein
MTNNKPYQDPFLRAVQISGDMFSPIIGISPHHVKNSQLINTMGTLNVGLRGDSQLQYGFTIHQSAEYRGLRPPELTSERKTPGPFQSCPDFSYFTFSGQLYEQNNTE